MVPSQSDPYCLLFDNGSLRPEATLNLRMIASRLQAEIGVEVQPVSLLHSGAIPAGDLNGTPAQLLEPAIESCLVSGVPEIILLPLFFGPSDAISVHLPRTIGRLCRSHPGQTVRLGRCLVDPADTDDFRIASILAGNVRAVIAAQGLQRPPVVLVDHGSPQRAVIAVRDFLAGQLATLLAGETGQLIAASMERRPGAEYNYCDPLLSAALRKPGFCRGTVVVAQQFLSPGRHAGAGGDISRICHTAENECSELRVYPTSLIGADPGLIPVLCDRYFEARDRATMAGLRSAKKYEG
jgi:sirohydrochlorin ferrochelatase